MKHLLCGLTILGLCATCMAQDLDTTNITDQFNAGLRGNASGSLTYGASLPDGTEYLDYSGSDATGTPIRYVNAYAGASSGDAANGESPVETVTAAHTQPDYPSVNTVPAIAANPQSGATGGNTALIISDDGGYNGISFGESDDANYYVEVDAYLWDQSALGTSTYESVMLGARCGRDNDPTVTDYSWCVDRSGSYSIFYDAQLKEIRCVKWTVGNTYQDVQTRVEGTYTQFGSTIPVASPGWHRFRIECKQTRIVFTVDGSVAADVEDSTFTNGRPALAYRESGIDTASERPAHFDNLKAGPASSESAASDWTLY